MPFLATDAQDRSAHSTPAGRSAHTTSTDRSPIAVASIPFIETGEWPHECRPGDGGEVPYGCFRAGRQNRTMPRLLDRQAAFNQSMGRMNIRRLNKSASTWALRRDDLFHSLVDATTYKVLFCAVAVIIVSWLFFAALFRAVSRQCGLDANTYLRSLYLAIETVETIGFGVPDSYFQDCHVGLFVLGAASLWQSLLNAVLISIVYTRISRAQARATSVCFSEKAVISMIDGKPYFLFQVCDFRKHQLCEAHVRLYGVQHTDTNTGAAFQTRAMRLQHPDDQMGSMLLLALPQLVVHRIDAWSPLCPMDHQCQLGSTPATSFRFPDVLQREADGESGNRDAKPTAGGSPHRPLSLAEIARNLVAGQHEVVCLVEGVDPLTSGTLQARHSYTGDDIVFNASFRQCVLRAPDGTCEIDFDLFHELVEHRPSTEMLAQSIP